MSSKSGGGGNHVSTLVSLPPLEMSCVRYFGMLLVEFLCFSLEK